MVIKYTYITLYILSHTMYFPDGGHEIVFLPTFLLHSSRRYSRNEAGSCYTQKGLKRVVAPQQSL